MKSLIVLLAAAVSLSTANATANNPPDLKKVAQDVAKIKNDVGTQLEIAGAYQIDPSTGKGVLRTGDDYLTAVANSYIYADFNKDGIVDLAVVFEDAPSTLADGENSMGTRTIQVFLGDQKGYFDTLVSNTQLVLTADDGGVFGDPFDGLALSKSGSLTINHYGGSTDRWALVQTYEYRGKDMYWVGDTRTEYNDHTQIGSTTDINLITGDEIITQMLAGGRDQVTHKKVPVKPLVRMAVANPNPNY